MFRLGSAAQAIMNIWTSKRACRGHICVVALVCDPGQWATTEHDVHELATAAEGKKLAVFEVVEIKLSGFDVL